MITAISSFKQNGANVSSNQKANKVNVSFSSNLDAEFRALKKRAEALGINVAPDDSFAWLSYKVDHVNDKVEKTSWLGNIIDYLNEKHKNFRR